jgi:hypothetical protein
MDDLDIVTQLLRIRRDKVQEILLRCCKELGMRDEMMACLINTRGGHPSFYDSSNGANMPLSMSNDIPFPDTHHSEPSRPQQKPARRISTTSRQYSLLSPPRTASSVTSHSVKNDVVAGEDVVLSVVTEEGTINKHVVRMRAAPIQHSLIGENVIFDRGLRPNLDEIEEFRVSVPHGADFEDFEDVKVSYSIILTWRRSISNSTHATKFYVVPKDTIHTDLLLGHEDSGQGTLGMYISFVVALL